MTKHPIEFVSEFLPEVFNAAIAEMRVAADGGDPEANKRHGDLKVSAWALRVVLEGEGGADLYLVVKDAAMHVTTTTPAVDVVVALAVPFEALEVALDELGGDIEAALPRVKKRITRLRAAEAMGLFQRLKAEPLHFHHVFKDTPDFDQVLVKIALGSGTPPAKPTFTVTLDYDTLVDMRAGRVKPQAVMGRLQLTGDVSRAMALGMELMQSRS